MNKNMLLRARIIREKSAASNTTSAFELYYIRSNFSMQLKIRLLAISLLNSISILFNFTRMNE